jgi:hypothetical protein
MSEWVYVVRKNPVAPALGEKKLDHGSDGRIGPLLTDSASSSTRV